MNSNSPRRASATTPQPLRLQQRLALNLLTRSQPSNRACVNDGFTLIESLVAIVIIAVTIVSITPPIFWATATRVQNRRAEQAVQIAQGEVDRVRAVVERKTATLEQLPPESGSGSLKPDAAAPNNVIPAGTKLRSQVPGCNVDDGNQTVSVGDAILVDTDPEPVGSATPCAPEFLVQTFRGNGLPNTTATTVPDGFVMGVRVYSIIAEDSIRGGTAKAEAGSLRSTNGLGSQKTRPLTVLYSTVVKSNRSDGLGIYRQLCEAAGQACFAAPGT
ncbi:type II secretion system protein [filamentous cyanobacterium LEGE 11480]|uniref:Type II secretion system protein n=1 Tax=Romeriopsis navalis LEGE 11480 TaxID=2777977 RepID=A0A928VJ12_9CYAN|nr:type II secretion system GspH family protein [Romeriopsis navalis]MBE9029235.1 type II secretion system protein [Romeriopsis navalis LEGE 11480]